MSIEKQNNRIKRTFYDKYIKRLLDIVCSLAIMGILSPAYLIVAISILAEDGSPVIFAQKRVGINKTTFMAHKFRSMKKDAPSDVPTHLMIDSLSKYTTRTGRIIRKYSLDELPQFYDILIGNMSIVGPRCALWNQDDLMTERDLYSANEIRPGLTGWAQINGRDELSISEKAKFDGYYTEMLTKSSASGFLMDLKCFFGSIAAVIKSDGVAE